jgi:hypothetical protein
MAIKVGFFEDQKPEHYVEGPFVLVFASGYRVEMENKNGPCSVMPNQKVMNFIRENGYEYNKSCSNVTDSSPSFIEVRELCDFLNRSVMIGTLKLHEKEEEN